MKQFLFLKCLSRNHLQHFKTKQMLVSYPATNALLNWTLLGFQPEILSLQWFCDPPFIIIIIYFLAFLLYTLSCLTRLSLISLVLLGAREGRKDKKASSLLSPSYCHLCFIKGHWHFAFVFVCDQGAKKPKHLRRRQLPTCGFMRKFCFLKAARTSFPPFWQFFLIIHNNTQYIFILFLQ